MNIPTNKKVIEESFTRDGYAVIRGFLNRAQVENASQQVSHFIDNVLPQLDASEAMFEDRENPETLKQIPNLSAHSPFFQEMLSSERFVDLAELLLDGQVAPVGIQWFDKAPGASQATPAHQDGFFFMLQPNEAVTMWLALGDVDDANGCLRYVPGSHRTGLRNHGRTDVVGFSQAITDYDTNDREREVAIHAEPGDLLVHHSLTIHTAGANTSSNRHRRALQMVYYAEHAKQDKEQYQAYEESLKNELVENGKL